MNQLPEPPLYKHSVHKLQLEPPLALTYADRVLLQRLRFATICDGDGHMIFTDEKGAAVHTEASERIGSTGAACVSMRCAGVGLVVNVLQKLHRTWVYVWEPAGSPCIAHAGEGAASGLVWGIATSDCQGPSESMNQRNVVNVIQCGCGCAKGGGFILDLPLYHPLRRTHALAILKMLTILWGKKTIM